MSLPHLNSNDLTKLRKLSAEAVQQMQEIETLRSSLNETIKSVAIELDLPLKPLKQAIKVQFKDNMVEVKEAMTETEEIVDVINNTSIQGI